MPQRQRIDTLWFDLWPCLAFASCLKRVEVYNVDNPVRLVDLLTHFVEQKYEGLVVRNPLPPYVRKRTVDMLKWKPKHKDSYLIVDVEEEHDQYGTPKNTLGAIWCQKDAQRFKVSAGGFTHDVRKELWEAGRDLDGMWLLVRYPELTDRGIPNHAVALEITDSEVLDEED